MLFPDLVQLRILLVKMLVSNLLYYIYLIIHWAIDIYSWIIFLWAIVSWLPVNRGSRFVYWLDWMVEPLIRIVRRFIPLIVGIDFSPIVAMLILQLANRAVTLLFVQLLS